jgi:hypothetical protein
MFHVAIMHKAGRPIQRDLANWVRGQFDRQAWPAIDSSRVVTAGNDPWECARASWEILAKRLVGVAVVLHDDMRPCENFTKALYNFWRTHNGIGALWHNQDFANASRFSAIAGTVLFAPGGAFMMPVKLIRDFLAWQDEYVEPSWHMDDTRLACWAAATGRDIVVPYPNIVQHAARESVARPGERNLRSPNFQPAAPCHYVRHYGGVLTSHRRNFLISRYMHYRRPYRSVEYWRDVPLPM